MNHPPADVKFYPKIRLSARFNAPPACVWLARTPEPVLIITGRQACDSCSLQGATGHTEAASVRFDQWQLDKAFLAGRMVDALRRLPVIPRLSPEDAGDKRLGIAVVKREPA